MGLSYDARGHRLFRKKPTGCYGRQRPSWALTSPRPLAAGRAAYLAGFHAAQAFIFENTGQSPKTHNGVHTEFLRLTRGQTRIAPEMRIFLSQSYNLKAIADYETGPSSSISPERAQLTIQAGQLFVAGIAMLLAGDRLEPVPE